MTIDLPRNYYRVLNAPQPSRWRVVATVAVIVLAALAFGLVG